MSTETTDLVAVFAKSNGGTHNWRYKNVDTSLPAEEIKEACELLTTLDLFEQDGVKLFDSVLSGKFVTTIETVIFDLEQEPEDVQAKEPSCEEVHCFEVVTETAEANDKPNKITLIDSSPIQPRGRHYDRLTRIEPLETSESAITVYKESLPPLKMESQVEIIGSEDQKQVPNANQIIKTKEKGLFRRIFRRRSRNKEAPESTQRE